MWKVGLLSVGHVGFGTEVRVWLSNSNKAVRCGERETEPGLPPGVSPTPPLVLAVQVSNVACLVSSQVQETVNIRN